MRVYANREMRHATPHRPRQGAHPYIPATDFVFPRLSPSACVCEQGCPRCAPVQAKACNGNSLDPEEQAAEQMAARLSATPLTAPVNPTTHRLSGSALQYYQSRLGVDLSDVTIQTDQAAAAKAKAYHARAVTQGREISFGQGEYSRSDCQQVLSHELTHTAQQKRGIRQGQVQCKDDWEIWRQFDERVEREAAARRRIEEIRSGPQNCNYILFTRRAEGADSTGHAFFAIVDSEGNATYAGFYMRCHHEGTCSDLEYASQMIDWGVEGLILDDSNTSYSSRREYAITANQYSAIASWLEAQRQDVPEYELLTYNCTDFALAAGEAGFVEDLPSAGWFVNTPTELYEHM